MKAEDQTKNNLVQQVLRSRGFLIEKDPVPTCEEVPWYGYRGGRGGSCQCNDKPPQLIVKPSYFIHPSDPEWSTASVQFSLRSEEGTGQWVDIERFSFSWEEFFKNPDYCIETSEVILTAAWNAASRAAGEIAGATAATAGVLGVQPPEASPLPRNED